MLSRLLGWSSDTSEDDVLKSRTYHHVEQREQNETVFTINGKRYSASGRSVLGMTLNTFIREVANLKGTKFMCEEGGCGCCVISVSAKDPATGSTKSFAVNSCLVLVLSCHGWSITTVEGLGSHQEGYHPLQTALARFNGTQCGYCSPGMVMNMHSLLAAKKDLTMQEVEDSFGGNICRCTGYRPILDAFRSFAVDAPAGLREECADIEDIGTWRCPLQGSQGVPPCPGTRTGADDGDPSARLPVHIAGSYGGWYRVYSVEAIFQVFAILQGIPCRLVAGNTARGAYRDMAESDVCIDVAQVAELREVLVDTRGASFGANTTLSQLADSLRQHSGSQGYSYFSAMADHIDLVANVPVRNLATVAGNLAIKHRHREFPSDMFLLLELVGATLVIRDNFGKSILIGAEEFLRLDMTYKVMTRFILHPLENFVIKLYKIMPRAQNAHAIVNAGFLFKLGTGGDYKVQEKPRIVYGGIAPGFVHASATEDYLALKDLSQQETLTGALSVLEFELQPEYEPPEMGPAYRKGLAQGLFYKCVLSLVGQRARKEVVSGGEVLRRPLSSGQQKYYSTPSEYPVGQPVDKLEALAQCSGEAEYVYDRPATPGELYAEFVLTTVANGQIAKIDVREALRMPGVVAFFSAQDIPGVNNAMPNPTIDTAEDEELFCSGHVLYHGQPLGVVVAETRELAREAKLHVVVEYTGVTRPVINLKDAIPRHNRKSKTLAASACNRTASERVTHVIEGEFHMGRQYHYHMEKQTCCVVPTEDGLDVYPSTQCMDHVQQAIALVLGIQQNRVSLHVRRNGGAFGAKVTKANFIACACAVAANHLRAPVRMVLNMEDNMAAVGKRDEMICDYKAGVDDSGKVQYVESYFYRNVGCAMNDVATVPQLESNHPNCYVSEGWSLVIENVKTQTPSSCYTRSPGHFNGLASTEYMMEHIAVETNLDPIQVRLNNIQPGELMLTFIEAIKKSSEYTSRKMEIDKFNKENRWRKKGISLVPMKYSIIFVGNMHCILSVYAGDGSVAVSHGCPECGQGVNTKVAQAVAHALNIPLGSVSVKPSKTLTSANDIGSLASITSDMACRAATWCCQELLVRLQDTIKKVAKDAGWASIVAQASSDGVDLVVSRMYSQNDGEPYYVYGVCALEVEVDVLTGQHLITRADVLEDAGVSVNPKLDMGQVVGAIVMGLGLCSSEDIVYDEHTGRLLTNRSWNYWPPGMKDIPVDFRVELQKNVPNPGTVFSAKATSEPGVCLSTSLLLALRNAIASARKDATNDASWFQISQPLTAEKIWEHCVVDPKQFSL